LTDTTLETLDVVDGVDRLEMLWEHLQAVKATKVLKDLKFCRSEAVRRCERPEVVAHVRSSASLRASWYS
jgi:hypothetical protein